RRAPAAPEHPAHVPDVPRRRVHPPDGNLQSQRHQLPAHSLFANSNSSLPIKTSRDFQITDCKTESTATGDFLTTDSNTSYTLGAWTAAENFSSIVRRPALPSRDLSALERINKLSFSTHSSSEFAINQFSLS